MFVYRRVTENAILGTIAVDFGIQYLDLRFFQIPEIPLGAQRNEVMFIDLFLGFVTSDGRRSKTWKNVTF